MLAIAINLNIGTNIKIAANLLKAGEVVAIPTETVYGLAANAFDPEAVLKIFSIKKRPRFNPLIVHIPSIDHLGMATAELHPVLMKLAMDYWPGPLTVLAMKSQRIHDLVTAGNNLVAVRVPNHSLTLQLLNHLNFPLAAPSANEFGKISPTTAKHVAVQLGDQLEYILDGGPSEIGIESTILKMQGEKVVILRHGGISADTLAENLGYMPETIINPINIEAPGMLQNHYAPSIPIVVGDFSTLIKEYKGKKVAMLSFSEKKTHDQILCEIILSPGKNLNEAAKKLFSAMHDLEKSGAEIIIADQVPEVGIGIAINDRLKRASS